MSLPLPPRKRARAQDDNNSDDPNNIPTLPSFGSKSRGSDEESVVEMKHFEPRGKSRPPSYASTAQVADNKGTMLQAHELYGAPAGAIYLKPGTDELRHNCFPGHCKPTATHGNGFSFQLIWEIGGKMSFVSEELMGLLHWMTQESDKNATGAQNWVKIRGMNVTSIAFEPDLAPLQVGRKQIPLNAATPQSQQAAAAVNSLFVPMDPDPYNLCLIHSKVMKKLEGVNDRSGNTLLNSKAKFLTTRDDAVLYVDNIQDTRGWVNIECNHGATSGTGITPLFEFLQFDHLTANVNVSVAPSIGANDEAFYAGNLLIFLRRKKRAAARIGRVRSFNRVMLDAADLPPEMPDLDSMDDEI